MTLTLMLNVKSKRELVDPGAIRTDLGTQARVELDRETVQNYAEIMRQGTPLPPIMLFRDQEIDGYILIDGWHRLEAHKLAHPESPIETKVLDGTLEDARWLSYSMNATHGLKRSNADKNRAVRLALRHPNGIGKSNREIAKHVGVDEKLVRRVREELESTAALPQSAKRIGRDGRAIDTEKIGKSKEANVDKFESESVPLSALPTPESGDCYPPLSQPIPEKDSQFVQTVKLQNIPLNDPERLIACLFDLFSAEYREKLVRDLVAKMETDDGWEFVR